AWPRWRAIISSQAWPENAPPIASTDEPIRAVPVLHHFTETKLSGTDQFELRINPSRRALNPGGSSGI
ncbi:MAG: hypothetical protein ACP5SH_24270, partial [Syntrophobacteraceae bacterium]